MTSPATAFVLHPSSCALGPGSGAALLPILVDSPHSGMDWPADFRPAAPREAILTTWDAFVDELWCGAADVGASLLTAQFPRAYIDPNRAVHDIDPALLDAAWPEPLTPTGYTQRGMGLIRRLALPGVAMYAAPLPVSAVQRRIADYYRPYRRALQERLDLLHARFGTVWHINAHSMKSTGNAMNVDHGAPRPDVVVSDRRGATADAAVTRWIAEWFRGRGLRTQINTPYQGGDLVAASGNPRQGRHSVQIEFNRALYLQEDRFERAAGFGALQQTCTALLRDIATHLPKNAELTPDDL